jgi:HK97 family phage major capsid protein
MSLITELKERQRLVTGQAETYLDSLEKAGRPFHPKADATWTGYQSDLDAIDQRLDELEGVESRNRRADVVRARYGSAGTTRSSASDSATVDALRSAILEKNPAPIEASTPNPRSYYQPGVEKRDLLKSSPANFQPVSFYDRIIETMVETSAVLKAGATLLTTNTGEDLRIPRSTANGTAGIVAEAAAIPESDPTLGVVTLGAYKYGLLIQVSTEMAQDTTVDLEGYLAREAGTAIGVALGNHLINGTGSGQPSGAVLGAALGVTGPTGTSTSFGSQATAGQGTDLLNSLYGSLAEPYTESGSVAFLARNATVTAIRNLKASTGELVGNAYVNSSPAPFYVDPSVPALGANAKSVLVGDWSRYFVRMVNGIRFERSEDFAFANDLVTFRVLLRADAAVIDPSAIKWFANSAT